MSLRPDDHRRKWDRSEYQKLAQERLLHTGKEDDSLGISANY